LWREISRPQNTNRTTTALILDDAKLQHIGKKLICSTDIRSCCDKWLVSNPQNLDESKAKATTFCVVDVRAGDHLSTIICG